MDFSSKEKDEDINKMVIHLLPILGASTSEACLLPKKMSISATPSNKLQSKQQFKNLKKSYEQKRIESNERRSLQPSDFKSNQK